MQPSVSGIVDSPSQGPARCRQGQGAPGMETHAAFDGQPRQFQFGLQTIPFEP